ncbi:MAG: (2Fe-2S) ferredoxin domain-containing protein [Planctomycetota bacterium]|nr:(2Fe-2S) ferredoxin domain-containing protein [Planctomycetota bacterium]
MTRPYQKLVLICVHGKSCPQQGALEVCDAFRQQVTQLGIQDQVRVVKSGCLAQCGHGPMVAVEPSGEWFCAVTKEDVELLLKGPILADEPLPRLLYQGQKAGKNVLPRDRWAIVPPQDP